ncbi:MAG: GspH/FimT family pseudopilin [Vulcanimicrobiota bacterium]
MRASRGFSLIELILTVAISSLLLAMAVVNLWPARTAASSHSLADSLAEELRLARRSAVASGVPVAVALATSGLGPHSQALYTLTGAQRPQLERVRNFAQEFSGTYICTGIWGVSGGAWTRTQPKPLSNADTFDSSAWTNPVNPLDPTLIFTPSGSATSNGMPLCNGNFVLVASQGVQFQTTSLAGSGPSLNYHSLQRLAKPYCIQVSPAGHVSVQSGLLATDGSVALEERSFDSPASPPPPSATLPANTPPSITACEIFPKPPEDTPAGTALIAPDQHLSLRVTATDSQGDRLYCRWTASDGVFSSPIEDRMEWDGSHWVSNWEWRPPGGVQSGNYSLTCSVRDQRGAVVSGGANGSLTVSLESGPNIVFGACNADSIFPKKAKTICLNGTGERLISENGLCGEWIASSDGSELIYLFGGGLFYACHKDGSGNRMLSFDASTMQMAFSLGKALFGRPAVSPEGTRVVIAAWPAIALGPSASVDLFICDLKGLSMRPLVATAADEDYAFWSGDGRFIVHRSADSSGTEVMVKPAAGGPSFCLTAGLVGDQSPVDLCPSLVNGHYRLLYHSDDPNLPLHVLDFDSSGAILNPNVGQFGAYRTFGQHARLSPDGSKVAYSDGLNLSIANADGSGLVTVSGGPGLSLNDTPVFTPDSTQVVFWSNRNCASDSFRGDLYRVRVDGSGLRRITRNNQVLTSVFFPFAGWDIVP